MLSFKKDYKSKIMLLLLSMFYLRVPMEAYEDRGDVLMKPTGIFETEEYEDYVSSAKHLKTELLKHSQFKQRLLPYRQTRVTN